MEKIRIQKYISDAGVASRRAAEAAVLEGKVTVNGRVCKIGQKVGDGDVVVYCGKKVTLSDGGRKRYIMLNKPRGYVTTNSDEEGRKCTADLVSPLGVRLYPVGRLDRESEGLLLLTNDGDFANMLTHPSHNIPKIYNVKVAGYISDEQLEVLRSPLDIDGYVIKPVQVEVVDEGENSTYLRFRLYEGRNRQIRKMCAIAHVHVLRLKRIAIGDISLGELKAGEYRDLTRKEVRYLMESGSPDQPPRGSKK